MKNLKDYIQEGILDDMETSIARMDSDMNLICPAPTKKDFFKNSFSGSTILKWSCAEIIQPILQKYPNVLGKYLRPDDITSLSIQITKERGFKYLYVELWFGTYSNCCNINIISFSQYVDGLVSAKKLALEVLTHIANNRNVLEYIIKHESEIIKKSDDELTQGKIVSSIRTKNLTEILDIK